MPIYKICKCEHCPESAVIPRMTDPPPPREERRGSWTIENKRVYISCLGSRCRTVFEERGVIVADGHIIECSVCPRCQVHHWIRLKGWDHNLIASGPDDPWNNVCPVCNRAGGVMIQGLVVWANGPGREITRGGARCVLCYRSIPFPKRPEKRRRTRAH